MKRVTLCAILAFVPLLAVTAAAATPTETTPAAAAAGETPQPRAVVEGAVHDAGRVAKGERIVHDFVIRNEGDAPLQLTDVRPACGCTVAEYDETIPPGGSGQVHAVLDTAAESGGISKGITVLTNDPDNPRLILTLKALVQPLVFVRPGFARFIQAQMSEPGVVEQIVFSDDFEDLEVEEVTSPYPFLEVTSRPATEEEEQEDGTGRQWVLTMTLDYEAAPVGALADFVELKLNHPKQKRLEIPVSGFVRPMVVLTPEKAEFEPVEVDGDEPPYGTVVVKNYAPQPMIIQGSEVTVPGVDVDVEEVEAGREFHVRVTLTEDTPEGDFQGTIRLQTDHPKKPTIEIPLSGRRL